MKREPGKNVDIPFKSVPDFDDVARGKEVFASTNGPFEAPAKEFVPGPFYLAAEEVLPAVDERPSTLANSLQSAKDAVAKAKGWSVDRRNFMKLFSASTVAASTACVRRPVEKAIPFVNQPIDTVIGEATYYATTCGECSVGCGVLVKTREGRPVKLEGLPQHPVSQGALCSVGQASLQGLYHPERRTAPSIRFGQRNEQVSWQAVYEHLGSKIKETNRVAILAGGSTGHRQQFFKDFLTNIGSSANRLYTYDSNSIYESIAAAHEVAYGFAAIPRFDLMNAKMILGIGSDFLDVGVSQVFLTKNYTESHAFRDGNMGRHVQLESTFTITGSRADERMVIAPGSETVAALLLLKALSEKSGIKGSGTVISRTKAVLNKHADLLSSGFEQVGLDSALFNKLADDLLASPSVVLCGGSHNFDENMTNLQLIAILINELIGAYGNVLHIAEGWMPSPVRPADMKRLMQDIESIDVLIVVDTNPAFSLPGSFGFSEALKKVPIIVSMQSYPAEIDEFAHYILNTHHYLEAWGDEQPIAGFWSMRQPAVRSTSNSRQAEDVLLWLAATIGKSMPYSDYRAYLRKRWETIHKVVGGSSSFGKFFSVVQQQGYVGKPQRQSLTEVRDVASALNITKTESDGFKLIAPLDIRLRDGAHANKPALQETPDPLTTITWDTYVALNPHTASKLGLRRNDVVRVEGPNGAFEAGVYPLPGLHPNAVVVPRGNGHAVGSGTIEGGNGINPLVAFSHAVDPHTGAAVTANQTVKLTPTGAVYHLAAIQKHNDIANRSDIVKKLALADAAKHADHKKDVDDVPDLYPPLPQKDYRWGMSIDLTKCTGCGACVTACFLENNVPQVGREQVLLGREMHWIKIDRYFYGDLDNPEVTFQPMLCQHCNHAPCEAVCPVYATTHDPEGVNAMTYNRCIGTRYCANACPYKIRRFNWWTHKWNVMGERTQDRNPRALNPDVTVRTRGVMEKCNFCYQRVRDAKHKAKLRGTPLADGELLTACAQTCPADAIKFGNLLDQSSEVAALRKDNRAYLALNGDPEHGHYGLKTLPNVNYLAEVTPNGLPKDDHH